MGEYLLFLALLTVQAAHGITSIHSSAEELLNEGLGAMRRRDSEQAKQLFAQAIHVAPAASFVLLKAPANGLRLTLLLPLKPVRSSSVLAPLLRIERATKRIRRRP
jgi:hypothetical protein